MRLNWPMMLSVTAGVDVVGADQAEGFAEPGDGFSVPRAAHDGVGDAFHAGWALAEADRFAGALQRFGAGVDRLAHDLDRPCGFDPVHDLDGVAVGFLDADALAAAGFVEVFDPGRAGQFCQCAEIVFGVGEPGEAEERRFAAFGDVDVVDRVGAAHVERVGRAGDADQAEGGEEFFLLVEVRRAKPAVGEVPYLDDSHGNSSRCAARAAFLLVLAAIVRQGAVVAGSVMEAGLGNKAGGR